MENKPAKNLFTKIFTHHTGEDADPHSVAELRNQTNMSRD